MGRAVSVPAAKADGAGGGRERASRGHAGAGDDDDARGRGVAAAGGAGALMARALLAMSCVVRRLDGEDVGEEEVWRRRGRRVGGGRRAPTRPGATSWCERACATPSTGRRCVRTYARTPRTRVQRFAWYVQIQAMVGVRCYPLFTVFVNL